MTQTQAKRLQAKSRDSSLGQRDANDSFEVITNASTGAADSSRKPSDVTHSQTELDATELDEDESNEGKTGGVDSDDEEEYKEGTP